jgi:hypothetical protein
MKSKRALTMGKACYLDCHPGLDPLLKQTNTLLRERAGYVTDICYMAGVDMRTLRRWMTGTHDPTLSCLKALLNTIGYDLAIVKGK